MVEVRQNLASKNVYWLQMMSCRVTGQTNSGQVLSSLLLLIFTKKKLNQNSYHCETQ